MFAAGVLTAHMKSPSKSGMFRGPGPHEKSGADGRAEASSPRLSELALEAVLEAVSWEMWVVREDGEVLHASRPGRARLESGRLGDGRIDTLPEQLPGAQVRWLPPAEGRRYALVVRRPEGLAGSQAQNALEHARTAWKLTRRQAEVLSLLAEGKSNRLIASMLSCSERTVELHVASLFRKAACDSRTGLVAKFWRAIPG